MKFKLNALSVGYGKFAAVSNITTKITGGEFIAIIGPNGAGKSAFLKTLARVIPPIKGQILLDGRDVLSLSAKARAKSVSYLAQEKTAHWPLPVKDLIALGRAPYRGTLGTWSTEDEQAVIVAAEKAGCTPLLNRSFQTLSGGEKARVHMARLFAVDAPILLADEPLNGLDPYYQHTIMQTLSAEAVEGKIVLAAIHDLAIAKQYCSRIWVFHNQALHTDAAPKTALSPSILRQVFKIECDGRGGVKPV